MLDLYSNKEAMSKIKRYLNQLVVPLLLIGCIGTDIIDDEMVDEVIIVEPNQGSLMLGDDLQLTGKYYNLFGLFTAVDLTWQVEDVDVLTIDSNGLVTAISAGQTIATASFDQTVSNEVLITVVLDVNDVAKVEIAEPTTTSLNTGETLQLSAKAYNVNDEELAGEVITWESSDESVVTVDASGLVTAIGDGAAQITASSDGVESLPIDIQVGNTQKIATFMGSGSYNAQGMATLKINGSGDLVLEFSSDFETDFALGTFIYLSNTTDGIETRADGLELMEITSNGAKTFDVSAIDSSVDIDTYQYVIVLCKPAAITFGSADFEN